MLAGGLGLGLELYLTLVLIMIGAEPKTCVPCFLAPSANPC